MAKKETLEQITVGTIGAAGFSIPQLAENIQDWTIIFSFFFIIIPTGVWAVFRAYESVMKHLKKK